MISHLANKAVSTVASVVDQIPGVYQPVGDLEHDINQLAVRTVTTGALALIALTIIAALTSNRIPKLKLPLFLAMIITISASTLIMITGTVILNVKSDSGGPVHWHADTEFWACSNELELRDPTGTLSNKIGSPVLHEHDDHRIHLEGVVVESEIDASIGKFMHLVGGAITEDALVVPLNEDTSATYEDEFDGDGPSAPSPQLVDPYIMNDGANGRVAYFTSGQTCGDEEAEVQTFVYRYNEENDTYKQYKLDDKEALDYFNIEKVNQFSIYDDSNVPPGDCIIFEFDMPKSKTDKLCEQYGVRDIDLCEKFGVDDDKRAICEIQQVDFDYDEDYYYDMTDAEEASDVLGTYIFKDFADKGELIPSDINALGVTVGRAVQNPDESPEAEVLGVTSDTNEPEPDNQIESAHDNASNGAGGVGAQTVLTGSGAQR